MTAPTYRPPDSFDAENLERFRSAVADIVDNHYGIVVDCSALDYMTVAAVRVLENAARHGAVTLVNAAPVVCLLASVFGIDAEGTHPARREQDQEPLRGISSATRRSRSAAARERTDADLLREILELGAARADLNDCAVATPGLTEFERARLRRIESRIGDAMRALRTRRPLRDRTYQRW